jgi:hypothetical protein
MTLRGAATHADSLQLLLPHGRSRKLQRTGRRPDFPLVSDAGIKPYSRRLIPTTGETVCFHFRSRQLLKSAPAANYSHSDISKPRVVGHMRFELVASAANLVPLQYILKSSKGVCANTIAHHTTKEAHSKFSYRFVRPSVLPSVCVCVCCNFVGHFPRAKLPINMPTYLTVWKARTNFNLGKELTMRYTLDAYAKLRKVTISFFMYVRRSVRPSAGNNWTDCHEILYLNIFTKYVEEFKVSLKSNKNNGHFTRKPIYNFDHIALSSENEKMFQTKVVEKIKTHILCPRTPPPKIVTFIR